MRKFTLALTAAALLAAPAFAQFGGLKERIGDRIGNAVDEHNKNVNDAIGGQENKPPEANPGAAAEAGAIKSGWLNRPSADRSHTVRIYFAYPENLNKSSPAPGLVVLQEWWGINEDIQNHCREFAKHGFYAVAPDLYHGKVTDDPAKAQQLHDQLENPVALTDMKAAAEFLANEEGKKNGLVDPSRVGAIGWCMGGNQALLLAIADPRIKATALFYGTPITDAEKLKSLQGPVLGVFGKNDTYISNDEVDKFEAGLKTAGKKDDQITILRYDGAGHAFASKPAEKLGLYNEEKAKDAWAKTWTWLDQNLGKK